MGETKLSMGETIGDKKKKEASVLIFNSALNTHETFGACSGVVVTQLNCFNCEHSGWLLSSWACISTECSNSYMYASAPCFAKEKSKCFKSFEKCTISVAHVVNHGEMFDDSCCAKMCKWEWVSVGVEVKVCDCRGHEEGMHWHTVSCQLSLFT